MNRFRGVILVLLIVGGVFHYSALAQAVSGGNTGESLKETVKAAAVLAIKGAEGLEIRLGETMRESPYMHIYDMNGRMVKVVSLIGFGTDRLFWNYTSYDGARIKPGMYLIDVRSGKHSEKVKVKVVK